MSHRPLVERVRELEERVARLEATTGPRPAPARTTTVSSPAPVRTPAPAPPRPAPPPARPRVPAPATAPARPRFRLPQVNVPAVLGVLISLIGFSFLLKLAIDQGWLRLSIETRHILVELAGAAFVAAGWHQRVRRVAFSRALMGGGIATLCLTIYSAVLVFGILGGLPGFGLLLVVVVLAAGLAATLRSRLLATLGLVGGLAAPLLIPDGSAALTAILGYYALFAGASFALSFRHSWPWFNLLSFAGVFGCAALYSFAERLFGPPVATAELALIATLFACGLGTAVVSHLRRGGDSLRGVELSLVLGVTSATLGLLAVNEVSSDGMAAWSVGMAAAHAATAWVLRRVRGGGTLVTSLVATACGLAALAVPLALDGHWIVAAWAVGATVQIGLATRLGFRWHVLAGVGLLAAAALYELSLIPDVAIDTPLFGNGVWISGVWAAVLATLAAWWIDRAPAGRPTIPGLGWVPFGIGALLWVAVTGNEILRASLGFEGLAVFGLFVAGSTAAALALARVSGWRKPHLASVLFAPFTLIMLACWALAQSHPAAELGWALWPAALVVLGLVTRRQRAAGSPLATPLLVWLHAATVAVAGWELWHRVALVLDGIWAPAIVASLLAIVTLVECRRLGHLPGWVDAMTTTVLGLIVINVALQLSSGAAPPLGFLPLANPVDVAAALLLVVLWALARARGENLTGLPLGIVAFACGTMTVLRAVHWYAGVPFSVADMAGSMVAQTALTVAWAGTGLTAMVLGAVRRYRGVWLCGAVLMGAVVVKLFAVDLGGVDTGARIVSFLGAGALLLAVGYFAPVPPRLPEGSR